MYGILSNHKFKPNVGKYLGKFYTRIYMCVWSYFNYTILIKQQKHTVFLFLFDIFQYFLPVYPNDMDAPFDSRFVCWISQVTRINRMSAGKLPPQHLQVGHGWETHPRYGQLHIDTRMSQEDWHVFFLRFLSWDPGDFLKTTAAIRPCAIAKPNTTTDSSREQVVSSGRFVHLSGMGMFQILCTSKSIIHFQISHSSMKHVICMLHINHNKFICKNTASWNELFPFRSW